MACSSLPLSKSMLLLVMVRLSPVPPIELPICLPNPFGSRKYPETAFFTSSLLLSSQSTINNAIMAVTKSAYATFQAPP
jgi:hypothetical protein